jgi:hypothetical protein
MRILLLIILFLNIIMAEEISETNITITLPDEINEENITNTDIENYNDNSKLNIAILINETKFFKYLPSLINSIDAYLLNKDINFNLKVFDMDNNLTSLNKITQKYTNIFIYSTNPKIVNQLSNYPDNNFFLPIINKNQINNNFSKNIQNIYFGGLNFYKQIKRLNNFVTDKNYIIKEKSILSNLTTDIEKNTTNPQEILSYPINYKRKLKDLNDSYIFTNTNVVHTAQILSNFTYYKIESKLILSTQINYNPLLFSLTNPEDVENFIVANSLSLPDIELLDINMNLGTDLKFNWLNYTTSALLNKLYVNEMNEYPYFLNDFNLYIFNNQINYKTKLYRVLDNGFIEIN